MFHSASRQVKQMLPLNKRNFHAGIGSTRDNPVPEDDLFRRAGDENSQRWPAKMSSARRH